MGCSLHCPIDVNHFFSLDRTPICHNRPPMIRARPFGVVGPLTDGKTSAPSYSPCHKRMSVDDVEPVIMHRLHRDMAGSLHLAVSATAAPHTASDSCRSRIARSPTSCHYSNNNHGKQQVAVSNSNSAARRRRLAQRQRLELQQHSIKWPTAQPQAARSLFSRRQLKHLQPGFSRRRLPHRVSSGRFSRLVMACGGRCVAAAKQRRPARSSVSSRIR